MGCCRFTTCTGMAYVRSSRRRQKLSYESTFPHCGGPIQNWIQERVRGVSGHQERPKAFPMAHMNRMVIVYKHTVQGKRL